MKFEHDTFVIMEVPTPISDYVRAVQQRFGDEVLSSIPVHITLTGSGGVGVFDPAQEAEEAFAVLETIAADTAPIRGSFGQVLRFPNTDVFVLTLKEARDLFSLQARIVNSGLRFMPSPYPFTPHCTVYSRSPVSESDASQLLSLQISGDFTLDSLTLYEVAMIPGTYLRRFMLRNKGE